MKTFDLDERMINFSVNIIKLAEKLPKTPTGIYFSNQLIRSASSAALNYAEAQSGESRRDFIHKLLIALKELRETNSGLRILERLEMLGVKESKDLVLKENDELISNFMQSVKTARKNMKEE
ncbi:MAG: four helix bundle protein [Bacteroidales bacterium]|jgi:four helix bundle protein|nr:four helix bundle protein [Bacteroidales bacterium]